MTIYDSICECVRFSWSVLTENKLSLNFELLLGFNFEQPLLQGMWMSFRLRNCKVNLRNTLGPNVLEKE